MQNYNLDHRLDNYINVSNDGVVTFSALANTISHLSDGTNATSGNLLTGQKALVGNEIIAGSLADMQGQNQDVTAGNSLTASGSTMKIKIPTRALYDESSYLTTTRAEIMKAMPDLDLRSVISAVNSKLSGMSVSPLSDDATSQNVATAILTYWQGGAPTANISYEYHRHTLPDGGTTTDSKCNSNGGCFNNPVYNIHHCTGSRENGGGCYGGYVPGHSHSSSCYHTHSSSCYTTVKTPCGGILEVDTELDSNNKTTGHCTNPSCKYSSKDSYFFSEGPSGNGKKCTESVSTKTLTCAQSTTSPICGQSPSPGYYYKTCGKTDGYRYESEGIDYYEPSCGKTPDTIVKATIIYD